MSRPVIGICSAIESARWAAWEVVVNLSPRTYSLAVQRAGGLALILPPDDAVAESPDELLDMLDGLLLAGGSDIDPASYGAKPHPETKLTWPERDHFELAPRSLAAQVVGAELTEVKSAHHQGVEVLGEGVVVRGHPQDGVVEAI